jgi:heme/copper-type cytochrome/quinol oxidase subunit 3
MTLPVRFTRDLSELPTHAFGTRSLTWWGVVGFMLIEGTGFALAIAAYFFLMSQEQLWPPSALPPKLLWGTLTLAVMLLSEIPNVWVKKAAEEETLRDTRIGLVIMSIVVIPLLVLRGFEFANLNIGWDRNAYGSILWALLLLHTTHLLTDWVDTLVLAALMFTEHGGEGRRFVDTSENGLYWHFVVLSWIPLYVVIYWVPRMTTGGLIG